MKKLKSLTPANTSLEDKISFYHVACFLVALPFDRFYSELVLISFLIHVLLHFRKERFIKGWQWMLIIPASVFLLNLAGICWSQYNIQAFKDLQRQLAILLLPFIFLLAGSQFKKNKKALFCLFGLTCALVILYLYFDAIRIIRFNRLPLRSLFSNSFINHNFSSPIGLHATYLSMYLSLSLNIFFMLLLEEKNKWNKTVYFFLLLILTAGLVQLASRAVMIATFFCMFAIILCSAKSRAAKTKLAVFITCLSALILLLVLQIDSFQKRYISDLKNDLSVSSINVDEPRIRRWECAWHLIMQKPITGYGSGSEQVLLRNEYFRRKLYSSYLLKLNAHNQYLSIWLKTGLPGLLILLATLLLAFAKAAQTRNGPFLCFLILISVVFLSENVLDVNKGVFFYAFFFSFFYLDGKPFSLFNRFNKPGRAIA